MTDRLVLLATTHRVAPGLLSWPAWTLLHEGQVCTSDADHPALPALRAAGVTVEVIPGPAAAAAREFRLRASAAAPAVWLAGEGGDADFTRALGDLVAREAGAGGAVEMEVRYGSHDLPGARLLDVVATMDRLRSPGGCPWDAEQTSASLAPYLLEEAYEAYAAIEEGDLDALREELGDVLLQVAFHARLAEELPDDQRWSVDDVAGELVDKLVRRHPHVFADADAPTAAHVEANWDRIKATEKARASVPDGVPLGQPALALAAALQRRAERAGRPTSLHPTASQTLPAEVAGVAARVAESAEPVETVGELLFTTVALARAHDVDPEAALRGAARRFIALMVEPEEIG